MKVFEVSGTSMWPALKSGDQIFARETAQIHVGDLVVISNDETAIVHRQLPQGVTKGDRFLLADKRSPINYVGSKVIPRRWVGTKPLIAVGLGDPLSQRLSVLQAFLSWNQLACRSSLVRYCFLPALVGVGFLLRSWIYTKAFCEMRKFNVRRTN